MRRDADLATVRQQASLLAEEVVSLVDVISRRTEPDTDAGTARSKADILEQLLTQLDARQTRLKNLPH